MAFIGRGLPKFGGRGFSFSKNNPEDNEDFDDYHHHRHIHYYIPLTNTYIVMQIIFTFVILFIVGIAYIAAYKSKIVDPIANIKSNFMSAYLILLGIIIAFTIISNLFSKTKESICLIF